ncbi:hypothetical protein [Amycolatopsis thailandensis]|nr:hypothetical protein [Amycolatopsis thailandensis]
MWFDVCAAVGGAYTWPSFRRAARRPAAGAERQAVRVASRASPPNAR